LHHKFAENPVELQGFKYEAGNLVMGQSASGTANSFEIEKNARYFDRKIQAKMFTQPSMKT